jgi:hypothetical protein
MDFPLRPTTALVLRRRFNIANLGRHTGPGPLENDLFLPENGVTKIALPHLSGQVSGLSKIVACDIGTRHDHLPSCNASSDRFRSVRQATLNRCAGREVVSTASALSAASRAR